MLQLLIMNSVRNQCAHILFHASYHTLAFALSMYAAANEIEL